MKNGSSLISMYDFSPSVNAGYLNKIVPMLARHAIPANPINYAICYDYVAGSNDQLCRAIDDILTKQEGFDSDTSMELYKKYICNASQESFEEINRQIIKVIQQATDAINETCHKAGETNDSFRKKTVILKNIAETDSLKTVLQDIILETESLARTSQTMQAKLIDANREMEQLRAELDQVRKMATTDGLTGLLNRRAFDAALAEVVEQSESQHSAYLSLLDIDYFKRINDTYGHTIGDNVIKYVASLMKKYAEDHHIVARYGGEELAIIMPNTAEEAAIAICERIRKAMESSQLQRKSDNQGLGSITLSVGIAKLRLGDDLEGFIVRADKALYKAKQTGRNKVIFEGCVER